MSLIYVVSGSWISEISCSQVHLDKMPFIGTAVFVPHPRPLLLHLKQVWAERRQAVWRPTQKTCCMTTRTIFCKEIANQGPMNNWNACAVSTEYVPTANSRVTSELYKSGIVCELFQKYWGNNTRLDWGQGVDLVRGRGGVGLGTSAFKNSKDAQLFLLLLKERCF